MSLPVSISRYFEDPRVDELLLNAARGMTVLRGTQAEHRASPFASVDVFVEWLHEFATAQGSRLDPMAPATGGSLDNASYRWHAVLPPLSPDGPLLSIRRHRFDSLSLASFAEAAEHVESLRRLVSRQRPLVVAGTTGSGKTSLLAALLRECAPDERVVILESLPELPAAAPGWIRLVVRPPSLAGRGGFGLTRLLEESLRLRPDRIVLGEIRGAEELAVFHAAKRTGHGGVMATIHAGSVSGARARLDGEVAIAFMQRGEPPRLVELAADELVITQ